MQSPTILTETESTVHLLKINGYSVTKALGGSDYISSGRLTAGGYDWEVRYYPTYYEYEDDPCCDLHLHLGELLLSQKGADITLVVSGESFVAHKCILSARSPVFMAEFFGPMKESSSECVEIKDMVAPVFKAMLNFIYTGTLPELDQHCFGDMEQEVTTMAHHLLVAADRYGLDRLKLICENKLGNGMNVETVATTLAFAEQHNCSQLKARCIEFILSSPANLEAVMATEGYKLIMASCPSVLNTLLRAALGRHK